MIPKWNPMCPGRWTGTRVWRAEREEMSGTAKRSLWSAWGAPTPCLLAVTQEACEGEALREAGSLTQALSLTMGFKPHLTAAHGQG